jgi:hypothetical protein
MSMQREVRESCPTSDGQDRYADILCFFTPDLVDFLADLHEAPASLAQATVQLLPFGSRAALVATGLATLRDGVSEDGRLQLTPLAFAVMAEAAESKQRDEISQLTERARTVASRLTER